MWATVLVLALLQATSPVRVAIAVLLISRPRPVVNLLAYWLGGMTAGVVGSLGALLLLRDFVPMVLQNVTSAFAIFNAGYVRITAGVLALVFAALISAGVSTRQHAKVSTGVAPWSALPLQPSTPRAFFRLSAGARGVWQSGHPGLAFVAGLGSALPPVEYLVVLATILASGGAIGTQLGAAVIFTVVVLVMVEIPLVSYLATPAKTHALMLQLQKWLRNNWLQNWVRAHGRPLLALGAAVVGVLLVTTGMGSL